MPYDHTRANHIHNESYPPKSRHLTNKHNKVLYKDKILFSCEKSIQHKMEHWRNVRRKNLLWQLGQSFATALSTDPYRLGCEHRRARSRRSRVSLCSDLRWGHRNPRSECQLSNNGIQQLQGPHFQQCWYGWLKLKGRNLVDYSYDFQRLKF